MALPKSKNPGIARRGGVRTPPTLELCRGCGKFVQPEVEQCPFCEADVAVVRAEYIEKLRAARAAAFQIEQIMLKMKRRAAAQTDASDD